MRVWEHPNFEAAMVRYIRNGLSTSEMRERCAKDLPGVEQVTVAMLMNRISQKGFWRTLYTTDAKDAEVLYRLYCMKTTPGKAKLARYPTLQAWLEEQIPDAHIRGGARLPLAARR